MSNNGRIDISINNSMNVFNLYDKVNIQNKKSNSYLDALTGNWESTTLSNTFFCKNNIDLLNNSLRKAIYNKSNGQFNIGPQNTDQLKIIMRAIYLQNSLNLNNDIDKQVNSLNKLVLDECIPQVYNEIITYIKYTKDVSTLATPIDRPVLSSVKNKSFEFKGWF